MYAKQLPVGEVSAIEIGPNDIPISKKEEEVNGDDEDDTPSHKQTLPCQDCQIGFTRIGSLSAEKRYAEHLGLRQTCNCHECELDFVSILHLKYHIKYSHHTPCGVCSSFCGNECLEEFGRIMFRNEEITDTEQRE